MWLGGTGIYWPDYRNRLDNKWEHPPLQDGGFNVEGGCHRVFDVPSRVGIRFLGYRMHDLAVGVRAACIYVGGRWVRWNVGLWWVYRGC